MRRRDGTKKGRFERPSLMPASSREGAPDSGAPSSAPPARASWAPPGASWVPPGGGIVKARLLPDAGWGEVDTSNMQIPVPSPAQGFPTPSTRESMIPKAPPLPRMSLTPPAPRVSMAPPRPEPQTPARKSVAPPPPSRASIRPNDPWERFSLTPAIGMPSFAPGNFDDRGTEEHRKYTQALFLREQGRTQEALDLLDDVCRSTPDHAEARSVLLKLALEHRDYDRIEQHAESVVIHEAQRAQHTSVCTLYRSIRMAAPQMVWSERALLAVLLAADKAGEGRVVVDVTKMLLHGYPESPALPRALYASAAVQHHEGRPDLARATLNNLVARFPRDSLAPIAKRRLHELG